MNRIRRLALKWGLYEAKGGLGHEDVKGWIDPQGTHYKIGEADHDVAAEDFAKHYGYKYDKKKPGSALRTLHDKGWVSVGHGDANYFAGEALRNPQHPATKAASKIANYHLHDSDHVHVHLTKNDELHTVDKNIFAKHGTLRNAIDRTRIS